MTSRWTDEDRELLRGLLRGERKTRACRDADWGGVLSPREFGRRYGVRFRGDGWYLFEISGACAAALASRSDGGIEVIGWLVSDEAEFESMRAGAESDFGCEASSVRERTW